MLGAEEPSTTNAPAARPVESAPRANAATESSLPEVVWIQDASGERRPFAFAEAAADALVLVFPDAFAGRQIDLTLWRRIDGQREGEAWMSLSPVVRDDATLPMAGVVPGRYDIEAGLPEQPTILVEGQTAPGRVALVPATPVR